MNLIAAGPIVTTQIAGKMQKTSGNTILTPVFAAASSARCRRLVRSVSEWTRSDCATLVPNLSVCTSIVTSDVMSSSCVRLARLCNASLRAGKGRADALRNLAERTDVDDISSLVAMLVQTDKFGTSVAQSLRVHSDTLRTKRRQRAEEAAAKTGVKMVFPLVFCIFPAIWVVTIGPAVIKFVQVVFPLAQK